MAGFSLLGMLDETQSIVQSVSSQLFQQLGTAVEASYGPALIETVEGSSTVSRLTDVVVWNSEGGQKVLAGLDSLGDQADRVSSVVTNIETAQMAAAGTLGAIQAVSIATLGVTSLSGALMLLRFNALSDRLNRLSRKIDDVEGQIAAGQKAHLLNSIQFLENFETKHQDRDLGKAYEEAKLAANTYGLLTQNEATGQRRLPVMNYRGRCYMVALMTELRCMILQDDMEQVIKRVENEKPKLEQAAKAVFDETVGKAPEMFLDPSLTSDGVTLGLMTEVYQQAHHAGAVSEPEIGNASEMFEHVRSGIFRSRKGLSRIWRPAGRAKKRCLEKLRYLMSCVEDTNRIKALGLMCGECRNRNILLRELDERVKSWKSERPDGGVLAYGFE